MADEPGGPHASPPHHHPIGAGLLQAAQGIGGGVDVAVGNHRDRQGVFDSGDGLPIGASFEALFPGAAMEGEQLGPSALQLTAPGHRVEVTAAPAQPGLHGDWDRDGRRDRLHDAAGQIGFADQAAAAPFFGDLFDRAAHVDVDQEGPGGLRPAGRIGHRLGPVIKELNADGPLLEG